ncbi:TIGR04028 family ABC transporter substrate-binding protein [Pannonibacter tanglangensis]|uniref:TIGR04028 family ABC transporter substrate-binding protein n=1 Tax=Pannonibacter tanglangensis TaxID=2750084 RepID=A0ABW9ZIS4_9HYPH|nr:TIGR04028 family ABC transporter substrate-binding protein [Pannonibacter sp. XCT-34]NBN64767.1 TIGR04028 family ABC transporter substrate-binding protein [Pannonibacter sp. XCT-34]
MKTQGTVLTKTFAAAGLAALLATTIAGSAIATETPKIGGTLTYLEQQPHTVLYPPAGGFYPNGGILNQITDKLTYQNPETLAIEPWIAESWEINADYTQFTFKIRPGVTFSDGTPLDAAAVAANFDAFGKGKGERKFPVSEVVNNYDRSEVIDPLTVRFHFKKPSAGFLQGTSVIGSGLVSLSTLNRNFDELGDATLVIGSGPFVATKQVTGKELTLKARTDYNWGPKLLAHQGRPYLDEIRYVIVPEDGVRIGALLSGQADFVRQIQAYDEPQVSARGYQIYAPSTRGINNSVVFRPDNALVADKAVRQALLHATDTQEIVKTLFSDNYPVATSIIASTALGYKDISAKLTHDPKKAAELLDQAGWKLEADGLRRKDGKLLELTAYESPPQPQNKATLQLISQQWGKVGVKFNVLAGDAGSRVQDSLDPQKTPVAPAMVGRADPDVIKSQYHYANRNVLLQTGGVSTKVESFRDETLNALLDGIAAEVDPAKRLKLVEEVQNYVIDQAYAIPIFEEPQVFGGAPYLKGIRFEAVGRPSFYSAWLDR